MIGAAPALADSGSKRGDARNATVSVSYSTGAVNVNARSHKANTRVYNKPSIRSARRSIRAIAPACVLTEENVRSKSKRSQVMAATRRTKRICTVEARGPQAHYVSKKRLRKIAQSNCAKRAQIRIVVKTQNTFAGVLNAPATSIAHYFPSPASRDKRSCVLAADALVDEALNVEALGNLPALTGAPLLSVAR